MLSVALAFASIALNISHARLRSYMFATRLFFDDFILLHQCLLRDERIRHGE